MSSIAIPGTKKLQFPTPSFCAHRRGNTPRELGAASKSFVIPAEFSSVLCAGMLANVYRTQDLTSNLTDQSFCLYPSPSQIFVYIC